MRTLILPALTLAAVGLLASASGCGSSDDSAEGLPTTGQQRQAASACLTDIQGVGEIGGGWFATHSDGSLWYGVPGQKSAVTAHFTELADVDGEAQTFCALADDNSLWCWGKNTEGQVGTGDLIEPEGPTRVEPLGTTVRQAAGSQSFTCAVKNDSTAWCWGGNHEGQLGTENLSPSLVPVQITRVGSDVDVISAGFWHACALKADETVWCWGHNGFGEIGVGNITTPQLVPSQVMSGVKKVSAGGFFTCAIDNSDQLHCWGDNADGHLGIGNNDDQNSPQHVTALSDGVLDIDTGVRSTCAVKLDGTVWCWGYEGDGRLGDGSNADQGRSTPAPVSGELGTTGGAVWVRVTEGGACAFTTDQRLFCWGGGGFIDGQGQSNTPVEIDFCTLPRLDSLTPTVGSTSGGDVVTLSGQNFDPGVSVFFGSEAAASVTWTNATTIQATTPMWFETTVDVRIANPGGAGGVLKDAYSYVSPPDIYQATPAIGPTAGGNTVQLAGNNLRSGVAVTFGGQAVSSLTLVDSNTLDVVVPAHAAGLVPISVTNADGQSDTLDDAYRYKASPAPATAMPGSGPPGTDVTLSGEAFEWNSAVRVDGASATVTFVDESTLVVTMPDHDPGVVSFEVENEDGQSGTLSDAFVYTEGSAGTGGSSSGGSGQGGAAGSAGGTAGDATGGTSAADPDAEADSFACFCATAPGQSPGPAGPTGWLLGLLGFGLRRRARLRDPRSSR